MSKKFLLFFNFYHIFINTLVPYLQTLDYAMVWTKSQQLISPPIKTLVLLINPATYLLQSETCTYVEKCNKF